MSYTEPPETEPAPDDDTRRPFLWAILAIIVVLLLLLLGYCTFRPDGTGDGSPSATTSPASSVGGTATASAGAGLPPYSPSASASAPASVPVSASSTPEPSSSDDPGPSATKPSRGPTPKAAPETGGGSSVSERPGLVLAGVVLLLAAGASTAFGASRLRRR